MNRKPLAMSPPAKAGGGERMMNGFQPIMQPDQVQTTANYYNQVFVCRIGRVTPMMSAQNLAKFQNCLKGFGGALLILLAGYGLFGGWTRTQVAAHRAHPRPA